jgi:hypothetical protein
MCTVTYIPAKSGVYLTSNRDEHATRSQAIRPVRHHWPTHEVVYPQDPDGGGTWIALKSTGDAAVLLNGAFQNHVKAPAYRKSRGMVFLDLIHSADGLACFKGMDLSGIEPFTLVLYMAADKGAPSRNIRRKTRLYECRWDGAAKYIFRPSVLSAHIWSSVTLYDDNAILERKRWFRQWLESEEKVSTESVMGFHSTAGSGDSYNDLLMNRDGRISTVSITSLHLSASKSSFSYLDIRSKQLFEEQLQVKRPGSERLPAFKKWRIKLFNWEYWSFGVVYAPIYFYWLWLGIKARSFFFFNASNPSIRHGGFLMESKKMIYDLMPGWSYPRTLLVAKKSKTAEMMGRIGEKGLSFPLIAKPDIGMRGIGVKLLRTEDELACYATQSKVDFLVQEFVPYEKEVGIFYYRLPGEQQGHISGIVGKEFLAVVGDGMSTIETLLSQEDRYFLQLPVLRATYGRVLEEVLPAGACKTLVPYGNHSRGAKFVDLTHLVDDQLVHTIDRLCREIPGFYYGRLDIKYKDWAELCAGKNYSVIELNGAGSEPTHIYDPAHSIFFAWREIIRHLRILYRISTMNAAASGIPLMRTREGLRLLKENTEYLKLISA